MHVDRGTDVKASVSVCTQKKARVCTVKIPTKGKSGSTITGKIKAPLLNFNECYRRFRCFDKQHNNVTDLSNFTTMPVPSQAVTVEVGVKRSTSCCSTENPLSSLLAGLKWRIEIIPPYAFLP